MTFLYSPLQSMLPVKEGSGIDNVSCIVCGNYYKLFFIQFPLVAKLSLTSPDRLTAVYSVVTGFQWCNIATQIPLFINVVHSMRNITVANLRCPCICCEGKVEQASFHCFSSFYLYLPVHFWHVVVSDCFSVWQHISRFKGTENLLESDIIHCIQWHHILCDTLA